MVSYERQTRGNEWIIPSETDCFIFCSNNIEEARKNLNT